LRIRISGTLLLHLLLTLLHEGITLGQGFFLGQAGFFAKIGGTQGFDQQVQVESMSCSASDWPMSMPTV
jgi:hypothetical protein